MHDEMRIEQITLNNYRQYYGNVVVKFATEKSAFSIVVGDNGAGKSNLWNAMHWCLFNEEPHLKSDNKPPIINNKYLEETVGGFLTTYVEMIMVKGNEKYLIKRSLRGQLEHLEKDGDGMIKISKHEPVPAGFFIHDRDKSELFQISESGGAWDTKNHSRDFRNLVHEHIIPENLAKFFILDGEFLQDLFKEFENIKSGIDQISQINVLNGTMEEIQKVKFNLPSGGGNIGKIVKEIERYNRKLASEDKFGRKLYSETRMIYGTEDHMHEMGHPRQKDLESAIANMEKDMRDLDKSVSDSNAEEKSEVKERHMKAQQRKKSIQGELEAAMQNYVNNMVANGPLMMCKTSMDSATTMIKEEMTKGNLPNTYKRLMVGDLLARNACLCGASLGDGTDARNHVEHEMERIADQVQYDIANDMRFHNERFLSDYSNMKKRLDYEADVIKNKKVELKEIGEELQSLKRRLSADDTDYADLIRRRDELREAHGEHKRELGMVEAEIKQWVTARGNKQREYDKTQGRIHEHEQAVLINQKDNLVKSTLVDIKQDVDETIREHVARETLKIYNDMTWKDPHEALRIDKNYQIRIRSKGSMNIVAGMAAGEKLFLALSFIMALKKITNYKFPFVIDSPLGKAGGNLKISFGKYVPKLLNGSQMIMLATNTEFSRDKIQREDGTPATHTLKELLEHNGTVHEHEIIFDKQAETASVIAGRRF